MRLNLPVLDQLAGCGNLLLMGMGGGFDIFCGLPVYFELRARGQNVHLGSLSSSAIQRVRGGVRLSESLLGVSAAAGEDAVRSVEVFFPELYLSRWFQEARGEDVTVWSLHKTGVQPLLQNYRLLIERLEIDGIILVDGGVDSLMRGDEAEVGTVVEDAVSLAAVRQLEEVPVRLLTCIGMGAEQSLTHAHVLENMAALAEKDAFLGSCSLVKAMEPYRAYEEAVLYVHGQRFQDPSVINASIVSAVQGRYGDFHLTEKTRGSRLWISPLMPVYWFFDLLAVAERNLFLAELEGTDTFREAALAIMVWRTRVAKRKPDRIPLP
jgi:hypothetical protein